MANMTGAAAMLHSILGNGVETIFGLPGAQVDCFFDAMYHAEKQNKLRFIGSRHEQGAAYMAFGYAQSTGKIGCYVVVPGPGVLNTTAALSSAYANNAPVLCVSGQIPSPFIGLGIGQLHEIPDQIATLSTITKSATRIDRPQDAPQMVNAACHSMQTGRPRPVAIEMAMDVMADEADVTLVPPDKLPAPSIENMERLEEAADLIAKAKRPIIVVGGGAVEAGAPLLEFAEMIGAPVISFRNGRGIISDRHYLGHNFASGYELWKKADLVIGIGSRMQAYLQEWRMRADMKLIRINIDPEEFDRIRTPDIAICADAACALLALIDILPKKRTETHNKAALKTELENLKQETRKRIETVQPQMAYLDIIRQLLPDNGYLVTDITQVGFVSWYGFEFYQPRHLISCGYQGTLGFGFATALGVKIANPDAPVIAIAGDGGFLYNVPELATAAQYKIPLVTIIFNNNCFANVKRQQREWFGGRHIFVDLHNPDFVKLVESFGVMGLRADSPAGLKKALEQALKQDGPCVIEVAVGDMASPWPFIIREPIGDNGKNE
ncbi:MAG: thiamine pyrophosphate-binding protein [Alphaproteobacteria bacterium]|nr:thiamine pyrophosphate-binding protein [Alphaproteobacteria bacterium]